MLFAGKDSALINALTVVVAARYYFCGPQANIKDYSKGIESMGQSLDDPWPAEVGSFDRVPGSERQCFAQGIISDQEHRVLTYLRNIDSLWSLGTKEFKPGM